jgi:hypothetical protein
MRLSWMLLICAPIALAQPAIDFSFAGYAGGGVPAPVVPAAISVRPSGGDDTALLQAAATDFAAQFYCAPATIASPAIWKCALAG